MDTMTPREDRFRSLFAAHHGAVLAFARRRSNPAHADDIAAETFLVAWRRLDDVPTRPGEALPWLYAVARHTLLNAARSDRRREALAVRIGEQQPTTDSLDTDGELRTMDAAATQPHDDARAADTLAAILATDPTTGAGTTIPITRRRHPARWAAAAAGIAAVSVAGLALSTAGAPAAYATWTATPAQVAAADNAVFETACRAQVGHLEWLNGAPLTVRLAERRGDYVAMLLTGTSSDGPTSVEASVSCVGLLPTGGTEVEDLSSGASGGGGLALPEAGGFTEGAMSQFTMGGGLFSKGDPASFVDGKVGPDVAALTIHAFGQTVETSIKDGTYAAWWPGQAFDLSEPLPPSGEGGPEPQLTYDVTLTDGTVLTDVAPSRPSDGVPGTIVCPPTCAPGSGN